MLVALLAPVARGDASTRHRHMSEKEYQCRRRRRAQGRGEGRAARTESPSVLSSLKCARTERVRIKSASGRARSKARYMRPGGPQTWASRPGGAEARRMGVARSRSHRAGGRPSTRTRTLLPHAVRVAVAAEARGGTAPGSTHLRFRGDAADTSWTSNCPTLRSPTLQPCPTMQPCPTVCPTLQPCPTMQ